MREQGEILKDQPDAAFLGRDRLARRREQFISQPDLTTIERFKSGEQAQQSRFSCAGPTEQCCDVAGFQSEAYALHHSGWPIAAGYVRRGQMHAHSVSPGREWLSRHDSRITGSKPASVISRDGKAAAARRSSVA